jgi:hypothetical protein
MGPTVTAAVVAFGIVAASGLRADELPATALDFPPAGAAAALDNFTLALTQTDGSIDVVLAERPHPAALDELLALLLLNTGFQVRFSVFHDAPERGEALAQLFAFRQSHGVDWHICRNWWSWPEADGYAAEVRDRFGGSIVFIDNGDSSDAYDNPDADFMTARILDPVYGGVLGPEPFRVEDPSDYLSIGGMFYHQVTEIDGWQGLDRLLDRGGWLDGC